MASDREVPGAIADPAGEPPFNGSEHLAAVAENRDCSATDAEAKCRVVSKSKMSSSAFSVSLSPAPWAACRRQPALFWGGIPVKHSPHFVENHRYAQETVCLQEDSAMVEFSGKRIVIAGGGGV